MARPRGKNWKFIGNVGVDSGQLMVCDPCYIKSEWIRDKEPAPYEIFVLSNKGKKKFPRLANVYKGWAWQYNGYGTTYDSPQRALGGLSINDASEQGLVETLPRKKVTEFSYRGCCDATRDKGGSGTMVFKLGHEGAGVAFSSGYGDGCYEVWGRTNEDGRIVEVRVLMG
jgi:hypothetical protein